MAKCPECGSDSARKAFDGNDIVIYCPVCAYEENISKRNGVNDLSDTVNEPARETGLGKFIRWLIK